MVPMELMISSQVLRLLLLLLLPSLTSPDDDFKRFTQRSSVHTLCWKAADNETTTCTLELLILGNVRCHNSVFSVNSFTVG